MITKMASKVADFFIYRNWIEKDEHEIYRYGMEVILSLYETQWKTVTIDVEQYAGKAIKLEFNVNNVGDNTYNSAVLIDNVLVA